MSERPHVASCQKIRKFGRRRRDTPCHFIAANAREDDAVSLGGHAGCELKADFGWTGAAGAGSRRKVIAVEPELQRFSLADVDMSAGTAALFFYSGEVGALVPVG